MCRDESFWIFLKVSCCFIAEVDDFGLELHLYQPGVEAVHEGIVDQGSVEGGEFEVMIMEAGLYAGFADLFRGDVELVGGGLVVAEVGCFGEPEGAADHLAEAHVESEFYALVEVVGEFGEAEVTAGAMEAGVFDGFFDIGG